MVAAMDAVSAGPRYAPEDPTLPKPWKGLVDGRTGYLYFWNPETNVTQYERPTPLGSAPLPKPPPLAISSKVQVQKPHPEQQVNYTSNNNNNDVDSKYERSSNGYMKSTSDVRNHSQRSVQFPQDTSNSLETVPVAKVAVFSGSENALSVEAYLRHHEITISGDNVPPPLMSFDHSGFPLEILKEVQGAGFSAPTPIQAQAWPIAMQRRDVVAVAKTGSGKTIGYLFPGFVHLKRVRNDSRAGPTVLVLSPTRELATQIQDEASKFGRASRISCTCLYGGAPKGPQLRDLERGVDIVVATPGRLNDILEMRRVNLKQVSYLVLDEADRMLDMGFEPQIRKIVNAIPSGRQTLMFTATWPKEVRKIAADLLNKPVQVNIGNVDELVANKSITQNVEILAFPDKNRRLEQILRSQEPGSKVIVFCSTKRMCDQIARNLSRQFGASAIHGDKTQGERDHVLAQFRSGRSPVLVATDVAARGLDIKDIRVVINFDFPTGIEDYVHRIGRTGRAGATGVAYTFISDQDGRHASDLIKVLEGADQRVPSELRGLASRGGGGGGRMRRWRSDGRDDGRIGGGRNSSSGYGGGWGTHSSSGRSDRGSGRPYNSDSRDRERYDGGYSRGGHNNGGGRERSRSRSIERYEGQRPSFHMSMMDSGPSKADTNHRGFGDGPDLPQ